MSTIPHRVVKVGAWYNRANRRVITKGVRMPWIKVYTLEEATGFLKEQYDAAIKRAGRIWNIVAIMSQNPPIMKASMDFYGVMMHGPSPLSRSQREMLATVTSSVNHCLY